MTLELTRELKREEALRLFKGGFSITTISRQIGIPAPTIHRWITQYKDEQARSGGVAPAPNRMARPRVDRDPCPKCNVRKDIGCKHFPKVEAAMSARDQAEALFR